jgi:hypothetical protein
MQRKRKKVKRMRKRKKITKRMRRRMETLVMMIMFRFVLEIWILYVLWA